MLRVQYWLRPNLKKAVRYGFIIMGQENFWIINQSLNEDQRVTEFFVKPLKTIVLELRQFYMVKHLQT